MKHYLKKLAFLSSILVIGASLAAPLTAFAAATATISLAASSTSVTQGATTTITVSVETGGPHSDGAEAKVTYDSSKLQYVNQSISYAGSPFDSSSPDFAIGDGYIVISRYTGTPPGPAGTIKLATFSLKALTNTGGSSVGIDQAASLVGNDDDNGNDMLKTVSGVTLTFAAVPPTTSTGGKTTPAKTTPTSTTTKTPTNPAAPVDPTTTPVVITPGVSQTPDVGPVAAEPASPVKNSAIATGSTKSSHLAAYTLGVTGAVLLACAVAALLVVRKHRTSLEAHLAASPVAPLRPVAPLSTPTMSTPELPTSDKSGPQAAPTVISPKDPPNTL